MAFGLLASNPNAGEIVLSEETTNRYCIGSGSVSVPTAASDTTNDFWDTVGISSSESFDCVVVQSPDTYVRPVSILDAEVTSFGIEYFNFSTLAAAGTIYYWLFKKYRSLPPATSGYGIEIYRSDGSVAFSSAEPKILKNQLIIPITSLSTAGLQPVATNISVPSDKNYAYMFYGIVRTIWFFGPLAHQGSRMPGIMTSLGNVSVRWAGRGGKTFIAGQQYQGGLIMTDITGY